MKVLVRLFTCKTKSLSYCSPAYQCPCQCSFAYLCIYVLVNFHVPIEVLIKDQLGECTPLKGSWKRALSLYRRLQASLCNNQADWHRKTKRKKTLKHVINENVILFYKCIFYFSRKEITNYERRMIFGMFKIEMFCCLLANIARNESVGQWFFEPPGFFCSFFLWHMMYFCVTIVLGNWNWYLFREIYSDSCLTIVTVICS